MHQQEGTVVWKFFCYQLLSVDHIKIPFQAEQELVFTECNLVTQNQQNISIFSKYHCNVEVNVNKIFEAEEY